MSKKNGNFGQKSEQQPQKLTGDVKKMKKSTQEIVRRTRGRDTGQKGDFLTGGAGDDTLIGSTANDVLMGGAGSDLLIGGTGNDDIAGDGGYEAQNFTWTVYDTPTNREFYASTGEWAAAGGAADVIYAGEGDDHAWGGSGNDVVFGEGGSDNNIVLFWRGKRGAANDEANYAWRIAV